MTTTPDQEEQLQLLDALIIWNTQHELKSRNVRDVCSTENQEINDKWKAIQRNAEKLIKADPSRQTIDINNETAQKANKKILQIIEASKILSDAYQQGLKKFDKLNGEFALNKGSREYISLQDYLRSIASSGKPELDIFEKIDKAIEDLKPLERLAADLDPEHPGKLQLRKRIELFVGDLRAILNNGKGSLALETVG